MGSGCKLLLIAFAIATDAHTDASTVSPDDDIFVIPRESIIPIDTLPSTVINSAVSNNIESTTSSVNTAPATPFFTSDSNSTSKFNSTDQDATNSPIHDCGTISSGSVSDRNTNDSAAQTDSRTPPAAVISKSSIDGLDLLSYSNTQSSADGSTGIVEALPVVFGALACVGTLIMAVAYKIKRGVNENDGSRPIPDCEYSGDFLDDCALSVVQDKSLLVAMKTPDIGTHDLTASVCVVNFVGTNSSHATARRHEEGIDVVLTFNEKWNSSRLAPEVHL
ncbi:unnamed protein product [Peronospora destructor]|uniref:Uncharacterized protein n=1 Tax=Peronospora destructor TaxID=86335 RepID=A0AAV0VD85_9STRA|nr:unnamed protein product [Peronospora destructor]